MVTKQAISRGTFLGFIDQFLFPTLSSGDVVVMDNLAVHKVKGVEKAIRAAWPKPLDLPPYPPDLNPIEMSWRKMKDRRRSTSPPTSRQLVAATGKALNAISPTDCNGDFKAARKAATESDDPLESSSSSIL